jgi:hypothetical protein
MKHVGIMELSLTLGESAWLVNPLVGTYFFFLLALVRHAYRYVSDYGDCKDRAWWILANLGRPLRITKNIIKQSTSSSENYARIMRFLILKVMKESGLARE